MEFCADLEEQLNCSKDFYRDEATGFCTPDCYTWRPFRTADDLILAASVVSLLIIILIGIVSIMRAKAVYINFRLANSYLGFE